MLTARTADPPRYLFDGSEGSCTDRNITFNHDEAEARIEVQASNSIDNRDGYLIRGDDQGPPPE